MYLIWSHEHTMWWGPNERGYVTDVADAGRYTQEQAIEFVIDHVPSGEEVAVPEVTAQEHGRGGVWGTAEFHGHGRDQ